MSLNQLEFLFFLCSLNKLRILMSILLFLLVTSFSWTSNSCRFLSSVWQIKEQSYQKFSEEKAYLVLSAQCSVDGAASPNSDPLGITLIWMILVCSLWRKLIHVAKEIKIYEHMQQHSYVNFLFGLSHFYFKSSTVEIKGTYCPQTAKLIDLLFWNSPLST